VLTEVNEKIASASIDMKEEGGELMFVTAFAGVVDLVSGEVVYASAGHDAALVLAKGAAPRALDTEGGPPLGVIEGFEFPVDRGRLETGEVLLLYTDGITEAMDPSGGLYGAARLTATLKKSPPDSAQAAIERVTEDVRAFTAGADQADDMTMLALRRIVPAVVAAEAPDGRFAPDAAAPAALG
jgi:sigma-B regulation protein RsbU (phosphoserine phosphatase)